jgi:AraC-like DNA-binding protein
MDLREVGLLYYVVASSRNLDDALRRAARYSGLANEGVRLTYRRQHNTASIRFHHVGVARAADRHQIECFATLLFRTCRQISGHRLTPERIGFVHRRSGLPTGLQAFFGCAVKFGSSVDEVVYAASAAALPVVGADPFLNALLERYCEQATAERRLHSGDWRTKVENALAPLLPHGEARAQDVCRELGVSLRTLSRRLDAEGLTFAKVVDDLRRDLAAQYLREPDLPISEIAWLLGYQRGSSFNHAFKRWTGSTPGWQRARGRHKSIAGLAIRQQAAAT